LAGLRIAAERGFRGVEFDAKLTRDSVAILMHDNTLNRTTDGCGPVAHIDWGEVRCLDAGGWCALRFAGERVPTLAAALHSCAELGLWPNVEIKPCPGREGETGAVVAREVLRNWANASSPPLLSSFSPAALEAARKAVPRLPRGLLVDATPDDWREQVERLGCFSLHCAQRAVTSTLLAQAGAARCPVLCYTVNRPDEVVKLLSLGVSAVVTDRLDLVPPS
jgi:glycerophosphoryl diester phosphodiesterase